MIENVFYENVRHRDIRLMVVELTTSYGSSTLEPHAVTPPAIRGIHVKNISARAAKRAIEIVGLAELPIRDVSFENVEIEADQGFSGTGYENVRFKNTKLFSADGAVFPLQGL